MTRFGIVIPFRSREPCRQFALQAVIIHLNQLGVPLRVTDGGQPEDVSFTPSKARNDGARNLVEQGCDVLVFNDADTIGGLAAIRQAVGEAAAHPGLVYAYNRYIRCDEHGGIEAEFYRSPSLGCCAIEAEAFAEVGRFDERYSGWGYDDCEFAIRSGQKWPLRRVSGTAYHLWHGDRRPDDSPVDCDAGLARANRERWLAGSKDTPAQLDRLLGLRS